MRIVSGSNIPFAAECFSTIGDVEVYDSKEITAKLVCDAEVLLVRSVTQVNSDLLAGSKVRFVGTASIGVDHIDIDYLRGRNIGFASAPGANANSVAEYVVAALLNVAQKLQLELEGKSIGVIGVGSIGGRVVEKCSKLGMQAYLNDPPLQRETRDAKYRPIEELYECDFITLHTPLTFEGVDKTYHLAGEQFFKSLKEGCVFINTSRGPVADGRALKDAIEANRLKAVVLDVWEGEPNIDTELLKMVDIGTPHIAGHSFDGKVGGMYMLYKAVCEYFGFEVKVGIGTFLPQPDAVKLKVNPQLVSEQDVLREAVEKVYDIKKDDSALREVMDKAAGGRGEFFSQLRENYPIHREFQNTPIVLDNAFGTVGEKLAGIGFKVLGEKE